MRKSAVGDSTPEASALLEADSDSPTAGSPLLRADQSVKSLIKSGGGILHAPQTWNEFRAQKRKRFWIILLCIAVPAIVSAALGKLFVTPLFESEVRFVVRGGESSNINAGIAGQLSNVVSASQFVDGYAVRDHLLSQDTFNFVNKKIRYGKLLGIKGADGVDAETPRSPAYDAAFDEYKRNVLPRFHITEQIVVARVFALTAADAQLIAKTLVTAAELFSDNMNLRSREDWLKVVDQEVRQAEKNLTAVRLRLADWRVKNAQVDPSADVTTIVQLMQQLEAKLITVKLDREQVRSLGPGHPMRLSAEQLVSMVEKQIEQARLRLGGSDAGNKLAANIAAYETLKIEQEFAEKSLEMSRRSQEQARVQLVKQQRYVVVVAAPIEAREAAWPNLWIWALIGGGAGLLCLVIVSVLRELRAEYAIGNERI